MVGCGSASNITGKVGGYAIAVTVSCLQLDVPLLALCFFDDVMPLADGVLIGYVDVACIQGLVQ